MSGFPRVLRKSADTAYRFRVLARAGMASGSTLGRTLGALRSVRQWGPLVSGLRHSTYKRPDGLALIDDHGSLTYQELDRRSSTLAGTFRAHGLRADQTVAVLCRDHRWMVETLVACGKLGVHVLLLNPGFAAPQLADVLDREDTQLLIHDEEFDELIREARTGLPRYLAWTSSPTIELSCPTLEELITEPGSSQIECPPEPAKIVLLTSGTTGRPKGAQREIRSGLSAADFLDRIPLRAHETTFVGAPMFHAVGFSQLALGLALGSTLVVHRRFNTERMIESVRENRCTALVLVPTMLHRLLGTDHPNLAESMSSLRVVLVSGAPLPPALCSRAADVLGEVIYNLYGSTEAAIVTVGTPKELRAAPGTVGRPPRSCTLELLDEQGQRITVPNTPGRVFAGGILSFSGYTSGGRAEMSEKLISTGDLGHLDGSGLLFVDGRADDMIISGGENVFPDEVENRIARHYQVKDVAVVGVPDSEFGQRLRAFVVPIQGSGLTKNEIRDYVRSSLAKHKVPRDVVMVGAIPRTATGKILRRSLMTPLHDD